MQNLQASLWVRGFFDGVHLIVSGVPTILQVVSSHFVHVSDSRGGSAWVWGKPRSPMPARSLTFLYVSCQ